MPSSDSLVGRVANMEQSIREHYGPRLDSVEVSADPEWVTGFGEGWTFRGEYRLKDLPLAFPFRFRLDGASFEWGSTGGTYGDHPLSHQGIGGVERFDQLARQFHHDFPKMPTMSYWLADVHGLSPDEPLRSWLRGRRAVVVYRADDYGIARGDTRQVALYAWSTKRKSWYLVHRGSSPDYR